MKKILRFLPLLLVAVLGMTMASCSDEDQPITVTQLPEQAKTFLSTYFPSTGIKSVQKDGDEYEVVLSDGIEIEFNGSGFWTNVEAPAGATIPNGFYPAAIDEYVGLNLDGAGINGISISQAGYEVELINGTDLYFNPQGDFIGYDPD